MNSSHLPSGETRVGCAEMCSLQSLESSSERVAMNRGFSQLVPSKRSMYRLIPEPPSDPSLPRVAKYTHEPSSLTPSTLPCTLAGSLELTGVRSVSLHASLPASLTISHSYRWASFPNSPASFVSFCLSMKNTLAPSLEAAWNKAPDSLLAPDPPCTASSLTVCPLVMSPIPRPSTPAAAPVITIRDPSSEIECPSPCAPGLPTCPFPMNAKLPADHSYSPPPPPGPEVKPTFEESTTWLMSGVAPTKFGPHPIKHLPSPCSPNIVPGGTLA